MERSRNRDGSTGGRRVSAGRRAAGRSRVSGSRRASAFRRFVPGLLAGALPLVLGACGGPGEEPARSAEPASSGTTAGATSVEVVDDAGRTVRLAAPAGRIVSLVPSVTETVLAVDGPGRLVARTRYDEDPRLGGLPSVGGGLDPSVEVLVALDPHLVVGWNSAGGRLAARLEAVGIPFYAAAIEDTAAIASTIRRVGVLVGRPSAADSVARALADTLAAIAREASGSARPSVFYWMAGDPPRTAGRSTFIGEVIGVAGGEVAFPELDARWPAVSLEAVVARDPDVIVVPVGDGLPGGGALAEAPGWRDLSAVRSGRVVEIPADLFARPGPNLGEAARALRDRMAAVTARWPASAAETP